MKFLKKNKLIILLFLIIFSNVNLNVLADKISDPNDIFKVNSPGPNQKILGSTNITWRMYDNDQTIIPYSAKIWDADTCNTNNYGNINSNNNGISSQTQDNVLQWNTKTTLSNTLSDGSYCLQICAAFKQGALPYSACNSRIISIINNSTNAPSISSSPQNLVIHEGESWQYPIQAKNPSGRALKYYFNYGTDFLTINAQTGLIQTNNNSKLLPSGIVKATYNIVVSADDGLYVAAQQQFNLTIIKDAAQLNTVSSSSVSSTSQVSSDSSNSSTTTTSSQSSTQSSIQPTYSINFKSPDETSVFKGKTNKIEWQLSTFNNISLITLNYSTDLTKWNKIISSSDSINAYGQLLGKGSYNWDVTSIADGTYYLQLIVKDGQQASVNNITKAFQIKNGADITQSLPLIINVIPENNKVINDLTPEISGNIVASTNQKIDLKSFKFQLDDKDYSSICSVTSDKFDCKIVNQKQIDKLQTGKHKINISIKDSSNQIGSYESIFSINSDNPVSYSSYPQTNNNSEIVNILGFQFPKSVAIIFIVIMCLIFLVLIIPWILYSIWSSNHKKVIIKKSQTIEQHQNNPLDATSLSSYSPYHYNSEVTPVPNVTTAYYKPYSPSEDLNKTVTPTSESVYTPIASTNYTTGDNYPYQMPTQESNSTITDTSTPTTLIPASTMPTDPNFDYNQAVEVTKQDSTTINSTNPEEVTTTKTSTEYTEPKATD